MNTPKINVTVTVKNNKRLKTIKKVEDAYSICKEIFFADSFAWTESCVLLCLNTANKVLGYYKVSHGGISGTIVDPKVIFTVALNCVGTRSIIISHNHPSGSLKPSAADFASMDTIKRAGKILDIPLLDSLIITENGYYSFADHGHLKL
jgi:DNA repair protein RadC